MKLEQDNSAQSSFNYVQTEQQASIYTFYDVIRLLSSGPPSGVPLEVSSGFVFLQKQLAKTVSYDGGSIIVKYFFGTTDLDSLDPVDKEWMNILFSICKQHMEYPTSSGQYIVKTYMLSYLVSNKQSIVNSGATGEAALDEITQFLLNCVQELDVQTFEFVMKEIDSCLRSLKDFIRSEDGRVLLSKLYEKVSVFLFEKTLLEQKMDLPLMFQMLGNTFISFIGSGYYDSGTGSPSSTEAIQGVIDSSELVFSDDSLRKTINVLYDSMKNKKKVSSGIYSLDSRYLKGGFESGRVYVFCARPGHGKSILLLNFAYNAARHSLDDGYVLYVTLENDLIETVDRLIKIVLGTDGGSLLPNTKKDMLLKDITSLDKASLEQVLQVLADKKLVIKYFPPNTSITTLFSWVSTYHANSKIKILFVDYLSLIRSTINSEAKRFELGQITLDLKNMSKHFGIPIVTAAQLNTGGYEGVPTIKNVDESRQIVQHADFLSLMYDPTVGTTGFYDPNTVGTNDLVPIGFNIDKNRKGPKGRLILYFDTTFLRFLDSSAMSVRNASVLYNENSDIGVTGSNQQLLSIIENQMIGVSGLDASEEDSVEQDRDDSLDSILL